MRRAITLRSKLTPAGCAERLLDPTRSRPYHLSSSRRDGELLAGHSGSWLRDDWTARITLRPVDGGTDITIRSGASVPIKAMAGVVVMMGCAFAAVVGLSEHAARKGAPFAVVGGLALSVLAGALILLLARVGNPSAAVAAFVEDELGAAPVDAT